MWRRRATVNQLYISESVLSKGVQLLFKTATFYLIFIPGLSLLFPLCHAATHLHESFWERRRRSAGSPPSLFFPPSFYLFFSPSLFSPGTIATATSRSRERQQQQQRRPAAEQQHRRARSGAPFLMHCLPAALSHLNTPSPLHHLHQAGLSKWSRQSVIREPGFAPCHKDDMV